jgi:hypothetical protein
MSNLYKLLEDKNYWHKKYLSCNEAFLQALHHAPEIAIDELDLFYGNRESLLKILEGLDEKIQKIVAAPEWNKKYELDSGAKTKIQFFLREKDSILERIILLDKEIILELETLHAQGSEKMRQLLKGKKALANYKSGNKYNEKIDKRV